MGSSHQVDPSLTFVVEGFFQGDGFRGGAYEGDVVSGGADAAIGWTHGACFLRGATGVNFGSVADLSRTTIFGLRNSSNQASIGGNATIEGGLAYKVGEVELSPRARFGWRGVNFGEATETGLIAPLALASRNVTTLTGGAELQASYDILSNAVQRVSLTGMLGYERWFAMRDYQLNASLANNTALTMPLGGASPTGPGVVVGLGVGGRLAAATLFPSITGRASASRRRGRRLAPGCSCDSEDDG